MNDRGMAGTVPIFLVLIYASIALIVASIILLFGLQITGEFYDALLPLTPSIGNTTPGDVSAGVGNAFNISVTVVPLGIVAAVLAAILLGGNDGSGREPPRSGGPPF